MRQFKLILNVLLFGLFMNAFAAASAPQVSNPAQPIVISKSQQVFKIRLASNPTTGYSWFIKSYDKKLLAAVKHRYQKPEAVMPGAGGVQEWIFKTKPALLRQHAKTKIVLVYARPWEKTYAKTITFNVTSK